MTEIYLHFMFAHYGLYGNAPVQGGGTATMGLTSVNILTHRSDVWNAGELFIVSGASAFTFTTKPSSLLNVSSALNPGSVSISSVL